MFFCNVYFRVLALYRYDRCDDSSAVDIFPVLTAYRYGVVTNRLLFCCCRWAQFRQSIDEIESSMKSLIADKPVSYKCSIGGGY